MPLTPASKKPAREELRIAAAQMPPESFQGPPDARLDPAEALYVEWMLGAIRDMARARYVRSDANAREGDDPTAQIRARWMVNQAAYVYLDGVVDALLAANPHVTEEDVSGARSLRFRRQGVYWWVCKEGKTEESKTGALLYDAEADLLFRVKGLLCPIEQALHRAGVRAPLDRPIYLTLIPAGGFITFDGLPHLLPKSGPHARAERDRVRDRLSELLDSRFPIDALSVTHARTHVARLERAPEALSRNAGWDERLGGLPTEPLQLVPVRADEIGPVNADPKSVPRWWLEGGGSSAAAGAPSR